MGEDQIKHVNHGQLTKKSMPYHVHKNNLKLIKINIYHQQKLNNFHIIYLMHV